MAIHFGHAAVAELLRSHGAKTNAMAEDRSHGNKSRVAYACMLAWRYLRACMCVRVRTRALTRSHMLACACARRRASRTHRHTQPQAAPESLHVPSLYRKMYARCKRLEDIRARKGRGYARGAETTILTGYAGPMRPCRHPGNSIPLCLHVWVCAHARAYV